MFFESRRGFEPMQLNIQNRFDLLPEVVDRSFVSSRESREFVGPVRELPPRFVRLCRLGESRAISRTSIRGIEAFAAVSLFAVLSNDSLNIAIKRDTPFWWRIFYL